MLSIPDYLESDDPNEIFTVYSDECPLSAVRIEKDKFSDIGHRDYLGAVMGLGLTRESVGDICVQPDGCAVRSLKNLTRAKSRQRALRPNMLKYSRTARAKKAYMSLCRC